MAIYPDFKDAFTQGSTAKYSGLTWASSCKKYYCITDDIIFLLAPVIPQTGFPGVGPGGKAAKPGKAPVPGICMCPL